MFMIVVVICLGALVLGGAADLFEAQFNSDELSDMGVQKQ